MSALRILNLTFVMSILHSIDVHGGFHILSFGNSLIILCLMEKYVFNSTVHQTLATTCKNYLHYFGLSSSSQTLEPLNNRGCWRKT